jgi:hypothetical protein
MKKKGGRDMKMPKQYFSVPSVWHVMLNPRTASLVWHNNAVVFEQTNML